MDGDGRPFRRHEGLQDFGGLLLPVFGREAFDAAHGHCIAYLPHPIARLEADDVDTSRLRGPLRSDGALIAGRQARQKQLKRSDVQAVGVMGDECPRAAP